jgi:hypothetical protein
MPRQYHNWSVESYVCVSALARDAHFLLGPQHSGIAFTAADMPNPNRLTVGIMAMVAEEERRAISRH